LMLKVDAVKPETPAARKGVKAGLWLQSVVYTRDGQHFELKTWGAVPLSSLISVIRECRPISLRFGRMEPPPPPTACGLLPRRATQAARLRGARKWPGEVGACCSKDKSAPLRTALALINDSTSPARAVFLASKF